MTPATLYVLRKNVPPPNSNILQIVVVTGEGESTVVVWVSTLLLFTKVYNGLQGTPFLVGVNFWWLESYHQEFPPKVSVVIDLYTIFMFQGPGRLRLTYSSIHRPRVAWHKTIREAHQDLYTSNSWCPNLTNHIHIRQNLFLSRIYNENKCLLIPVE